MNSASSGPALEPAAVAAGAAAAAVAGAEAAAVARAAVLHEGQRLVLAVLAGRAVAVVLALRAPGRNGRTVSALPLTGEQFGQCSNVRRANLFPSQKLIALAVAHADCPVGLLAGAEVLDQRQVLVLAVPP